MTKYQIIVLCLLVASILSSILEMVPASKGKGTMSQLHKLFAALTLLLILLIGYRAFFLIR